MHAEPPAQYKKIYSEKLLQMFSIENHIDELHSRWDD